MKEFKVKIQPVKLSNSDSYYILKSKRSGDFGFLARLSLDNAAEMRQVAKVLNDKANEIDEIDDKDTCPVCDNVGNLSGKANGRKVYACPGCDQFYSDLGELVYV